MKKIITACALAAGVLTLASCNDFLDQKSPSELSKDNVYNSEYYTSTVINQIYGDLTNDRTYSQDWAILYGLGTDCELVDGIGSTATAASERGYFNYNINGEYSNASKMWTYMYATIEDANLAIEGIEGSSLKDETTMQQYYGEAVCLRAMVYLDLIRAFGDIPMKLESSKSDLSNAYQGKTDRDIILDTLLNQVEEVISLLPWAGTNSYTTEHVTKGYAHALAAQLALTRAGYAIRESAKEGYETASYSDPTYPTQRPDATTRATLYRTALKHLSAIITSGVHKLNPSFENEWYLINQLTLDTEYQENLFEIPMLQDVSGELGYTAGYRLNGVTTQYGYSNSSGKLKVTAPLFYSYDKNDDRRDITCATTQIVPTSKTIIANSDTTVDATCAVETELGNTPFGLYCGKWDPRKENDTWLAQNLKASAKHMTGINVVKVRYPQVLLWYAEVMNELVGPDATDTDGAGITAREALRQVHARAFSDDNKAAANAYVAAIAADKDSFFNAIVQENAWELAGEGARKWDLIRWNLLAQKIYEMKQAYLTELNDGTYQETIYFNYSDANQTKIDASSVTWYGLPTGKTAADYDNSVTSFGKYNETQAKTNLNSICGGLVGEDPSVLGQGDVKNRYLVPIGTTITSASNGYIKNSYDFPF
ncbi:MAG: RagB/SusD family nutrient uptake outer membrane protein [Prevotella sp.]|nr:RagB/SusD family nutrient uptake outer membrane protein [Prevotella sp.]